MRARIETIKEFEEKDNETEALMSNVLGQFSRIVELSPGLPPEIGQMAKTVQEPGTLADMVAAGRPFITDAPVSSGSKRPKKTRLRAAEAGSSRGRRGAQHAVAH